MSQLAEGINYIEYISITSVINYEVYSERISNYAKMMLIDGGCNIQIILKTDLTVLCIILF